MKNKILIVGAGVAGRQIQEELQKQGHCILGFLDDFKKDKEIVGKISDLKFITEKEKIDEIYIAMPSVERSAIQKMTEESLFGFSGKIRIVPSYVDVLHGKAQLKTTKKIKIEDLLGRPPIKHDFEVIEKFIQEKVIFLTGAAGSIGSELARQIIHCSPKKLICFDVSEAQIFFLEQEIGNLKNIEYVIGNICDTSRLENIFKKHPIDIVFHAAAYKHVPLMEENPYEAIHNNIGGTKNVINVSTKYSVPNLVLVSTDKAVNPTNIMGATKRVGEKMMECYCQKFPKTKMTAVRFGNVLGSNGSVVQTFERKIENEEPISVTHPEIIRYFMTIPEAAQLILLSATLGENNEIFVLDMGEPVKIMDLAKKMIRLKGFIPGKDIPIIITGLRPGEKLYEELLVDGVTTRTTQNKKIFITKKEEEFEKEVFLKKIKKLLDSLSHLNSEEISIFLKDLVPNFSHLKHKNITQEL